VDLVVLLCLLAPAVLCAVLMTAVVVAPAVVRWRDDRSPCRRHARVLLPTSIGHVELCSTCDAGSVVDGQWEFAPPVAADYTL
jgi:hypothetical protein